MPLIQSKIKLPKGYLSHSQIACVMRSENEYARKYLYGEDFEGSIQQEYGKKITDILEGRAKCPQTLKKALSRVPRYKQTDVEIKCNLARKTREITLLGRLDGFSKPHLQGEYKTGMQKWTQKRVQDCLQLKIYALIHYKNTGTIPTQELTWIPTAWDGAKIKITGDPILFLVGFTLKDLLETESFVWKAHDKIINLVKRTYENV